MPRDLFPNTLHARECRDAEASHTLHVQENRQREEARRGSLRWDLVALLADRERDMHTPLHLEGARP